MRRGKRKKKKKYEPFRRRGFILGACGAFRKTKARSESAPIGWDVNDRLAREPSWGRRARYAIPYSRQLSLLGVGPWLLRRIPPGKTPNYSGATGCSDPGGPGSDGAQPQLMGVLAYTDSRLGFCRHGGRGATSGPTCRTWWLASNRQNFTMGAQAAGRHHGLAPGALSRVSLVCLARKDFFRLPPQPAAQAFGRKNGRKWLGFSAAGGRLPPSRADGEGCSAFNERARSGPVVWPGRQKNLW